MRTAYEAVMLGSVKEFTEPKRLEYSTFKHELLIKVVHEVRVVHVCVCLIQIATTTVNACHQVCLKGEPTWLAR